MQCPLKAGDSSELFIAYGAHQLAPEVETAFAAHLAVCTECRKLAEAQVVVWSCLETWDPVLVSPDFDEKLYARIAACEDRPWYRRWLDVKWPSLHPAMPLAAICAVVLAVLLFRSPVMDESPARSTLQKPVDIEQVERALDDLDMLKQLGVVAPQANSPQTEPM